MATNKRRRRGTDHIIRKLAEENNLLGAGQDLNEVADTWRSLSRRGIAGLPSTAE